MKHIKLFEDFDKELFEDFNKEEVEIKEEAISENVYPKGKGGPIETSLRSEEVGRLNVKHKGEIIGTLLVWTRPGYVFGGGGGYDENSWECGASYTSYPMSGRGGSSGTGVWEGPSGLSKDDSIKACKDFMKNVKMS